MGEVYPPMLYIEVWVYYPREVFHDSAMKTY